MKQHKLNEGKEELLRALLLMKYDTKKTLTENQENIKSPIMEDVPSAIAASALGGAALGAAAIPSSIAIASGGAGVVAGTTGLAASVATTLGIGFTAGAAIVGGAAAVAVLPLVYWLVTKDNGADRVKKLFQMCSTESVKISKLERKIDDKTIRSLSDKINDAVNYSTLGFMAGTDEDSLYEAFNELRNGTASDACALVNKYNQEYGDLYDDLDSDIDAESEWNQIYRPLRDCVEDSLIEIKDKDVCKDKPGTVWDEKTQACVPTKEPGPNKWRECSEFPLTKGCKGDKVSKIQNCLGISADGKFGPMTEKTLLNKGYNTSVTQEIYDKIMNNCGGSSVTTTTTIYTPDNTSVRTDFESDEL
jgi:hypothetical protein